VRNEGELQENIMNKEHKTYLDKLRKSGITNMFGAAPYIQSKFLIDKKEAQSILSEWMNNFKIDHETQ
jgi:hypothetical protein